MSRWFLFPVVALLLMAATAAATVYTVNMLIPGTFALSSSNETEAARPTAQAIASPIFLQLEPFTVTLKGQYQSKILYTGVTLRLENQQSLELLSNHMPEVRDRALRLLYSQSIDQIQTPDGQGALAHALREVLSKPYTDPLTQAAVSKVLFTAFVVQ